MNIYEIAEIEHAIENIAAENDGEIPESLLEALVLAQTNSIIQIESLAKYIQTLEHYQAIAKLEEERIYNMRKKAEKRVESIKKYLAPYVNAHGKITAGTFTLSTRKSESVELEDGFNNPDYTVPVTTFKIDKAQIKLDLKTGKIIPGATIRHNINLQIK